MTQCECPIAGFCKRHQINKTPLLHHKCQTDPNFWNAWESGRGPAIVQELDEKKLARKKKVEAAKSQKKRLISWLKLFRAESEKGIGDTADRLVKQRKKSPIWIASDAHDAVRRLMAQCSCSKTEAVTRLNREYPY